MDRMTDKEEPWSVPLAVAQIPEQGLQRDIEASPAERDAIAALAGLRAVSSARASLDIRPIRDGRVHVAGRVSAIVGQTCVVTLDPIDTAVDEAIDLVFVPESQIRELAESIDDNADDAEVPDPPEPIVGGMIDLGRLATDVLLLGIDPYPRKPGVVFEVPVTPPDPEDHPFAALEALKGATTAPGPKKPKGG
jgi:hypothetical protein